MDYKINGIMYTETQQHGSYIILTPGPCNLWEYHMISFSQLVSGLLFGNKAKNSWNPRTNFVVAVMPNCMQFDNKKTARAILEHLWNYEVTNVAVLFLRSNEHAGSDVQHTKIQSEQGTYLELYTWYPYENSDRCNPTEFTVAVKVFTVRNLSDIRRSDIFRGKFGKNFHRCPIKVYVRKFPTLVNESKSVL
jgi:hypothetical protein